MAKRVKVQPKVQTPYHFTPEEIEDIRTKVKAYYATHAHPMKGKTFSEEAKANMRAGHANRKAALALKSQES